MDPLSQIRALADASDGNFPSLADNSIAAGATPDQFFADLITAENRVPVSIASGQDLLAGEVLFQTLTATSTPGMSNVGNGVLSIQSVGIDAVIGVYTAICAGTRTNRGIFDLRAPDAGVVGRINVGTPFTSGFLNLTIADGSADFAIGDVFNITVAGSSAFAAYDFAADPTPPQVATAVLGADVDATGGSVEQFATASGPAMIAANFACITQTTDLTDEQRNAFNSVAPLAIDQLARRGIVVRGGPITVRYATPPTDS